MKISYLFIATLLLTFFNCKLIFAQKNSFIVFVKLTKTTENVYGDIGISSYREVSAWITQNKFNHRLVDYDVIKNKVKIDSNIQSWFVNFNDTMGFPSECNLIYTKAFADTIFINERDIPVIQKGNFYVIDKDTNSIYCAFKIRCDIQLYSPYDCKYYIHHCEHPLREDDVVVIKKIHKISTLSKMELNKLKMKKFNIPKIAYLICE